MRIPRRGSSPATTEAVPKCTDSEAISDITIPDDWWLNARLRAHKLPGLASGQLRAMHMVSGS